MSKPRKCIPFAIIGMLTAGSALADTTLTFDNFQRFEFEPVMNYYDGGVGGLGTGPGPNYGITFSSNALADRRDTPIPGDPSPHTDLLLGHFGSRAGQPLTMTMDVARGFSQELLYHYVDIGRAGSIQIWSGLDGSGTLLATQTLSLTPVHFSGPLDVPFSGTAKSVVFSGGNLQLALDDITLPNISAAPEPSTWLSLVIGLGSLLLTRSRWLRFATPR